VTRSVRTSSRYLSCLVWNLSSCQRIVARSMILKPPAPDRVSGLGFRSEVFRRAIRSRRGTVIGGVSASIVAVFDYQGGVLEGGTNRVELFGAKSDGHGPQSSDRWDEASGRIASGLSSGGARRLQIAVAVESRSSVGRRSVGNGWGPSPKARRNSSGHSSALPRSVSLHRAELPFC